MANPFIKEKRRMSNKGLVATFIAITIAVTLLFSVAVIFAFNQQSISSSVRITYKTVDITGSVTMYAKAGSATEFYKGTDTANKIDEFVFDVETETTETPAQLDLNNAELTKQNNTLYIHYVFENSGQRAYTAILSYLETEVYTQNMELKYSQTGEDGSYISSNYGLVVAGGSTKDYYVKISVQDLAYDAEFDGMFTWQLNECDESLTEMEEISLTATTFTVVDETKNEYSAQYNGEDISISGISSQSNDGIENIWYVPGRIGSGRVVSVERAGKDAEGKQIYLPEKTKVVIAEGVTDIGAEAFLANTGLIEIAIPNSVTSIPSSAFRKCSELTAVTMSSNVTTIGSSAFEDCKNLTEITLPQSLTNIYSYAFFYCTSLTEITIPNSVTSIGAYAFWYCTGLTEITIPSSVTSIGTSAFNSCTGLTEITIPSSVTSMGNNAFKDTNITTINWDANIAGFSFSNAFPSLTDSTKQITVNFGENVTSIPGMVFRRCVGLTAVTMSSNVTTIGSSAFEECENLTEITLPQSLTNIYSYAFWYCTDLTDVYFLDTTSNWDVGGTIITAEELQNSKTAATYLSSTYYSKNWTKVTE